MTPLVRFDPAAQRELNAAVEFYEAEDPGLGITFLDTVERALAQIEAFLSPRRSRLARFAPRSWPRSRSQ